MERLRFFLKDKFQNRGYFFSLLILFLLLIIMISSLVLLSYFPAKIFLNTDTKRNVFLITYYLFFICTIYITLKNNIFKISISSNITDEISILTIFILLYKGLFLILVCAIGYTIFGVSYDGGIIYNGYYGLYFSIVTWTTLGYGDLSPTSGMELFAGIQALCGMAYMAIIIAIFIHQVSIISKNTTFRKQNLDHIRMSRIKSHPLRKRPSIYTTGRAKYRNAKIKSNKKHISSE